MGNKRDPNMVYCDEPTLTVQSSKDECDINVIVARAANGGDLSNVVNGRVAQYGDFSNVPSYQEALELVNRANGMFMSLDAKVRERFANDAGRMVAFLQDPANSDEAIKLGLVTAKPVDGPVEPVLSPETKVSKGKSSGTPKADKGSESDAQ